MEPFLILLLIGFVIIIGLLMRFRDIQSEKLQSTTQKSASSLKTETEEKYDIQENMETQLPIEPSGSPFSAGNLLNLFIAPTKFFTSEISLSRTPYYFFVTWIYGMSMIVDRINKELMRMELGKIRPGVGEFMVSISESWLYFWFWVLIIGAVAGVIIWQFGGWWFGIRIKFSGEKNLDSQKSRLVYVYSSFIHSGPSILFLIIVTFFYSNYLKTFSSEEMYSTILLIFPFWALICSYLGVTSVFKVTNWKALLWFLVLPGIFYLFALGLIAYLLNFQ